MCGVVAMVGANAANGVARMIPRLHHRGPDSHGSWHDGKDVALGHTRLSIIDLSDAGRQPMISADGRFVIVFNGEVYNHIELRAQLGDYPFRSRTDSEVVLAAWVRWGEACVDRLYGMFAFVVWDTIEHRLTAVRDRFGVKPLYYGRLPDGALAIASEIKALHAAGVPAEQDAVTWATYLSAGLYDHTNRTFWKGIEALPAGCLMTWHSGQLQITRWYDLVARIGLDFDRRHELVVREEYLALLKESVRLRFRSDVPIGINLSGGLDSSTLLGLVHALQGGYSDVKVFSFVTGDPSYDELPWVEEMLERTRHPLITCTLAPEEVPSLAEQVSSAQDEPFGGIPTLAYAKIFTTARRNGILVLLDGQGMDEQWAGYDYYRSALGSGPVSTIQGTSTAVRPDCLAPDFVRSAEPLAPLEPFPDRLRNLQYRDILYTKLPRALRFNDRVSMSASTELREPFLDHRLVELAVRQLPDRKIEGDVGKRILRDMTAALLPRQLRAAAKRPVQTPQREWLRGPLRSWAEAHIEAALASRQEWFNASAARNAWRDYLNGSGDNSFWVWQWLSVSLMWN